MHCTGDSEVMTTKSFPILQSFTLTLFLGHVNGVHTAQGLDKGPEMAGAHFNLLFYPFSLFLYICQFRGESKNRKNFVDCLTQLQSHI